jgi:hypothetical protein
MNGVKLGRTCSICDGLKRYIQFLLGHLKNGQPFERIFVDEGFVKACFEGIYCDGLQCVLMVQDRKIYQSIIIVGMNIQFSYGEARFL